MMILLDDKYTLSQRLVLPIILILFGLYMSYALYNFDLQKIALLAPTSVSVFGLLAIVFEWKHYFDDCNNTIVVAIEAFSYRVSCKNYPLKAFTEILITNEDREENGYGIQISGPKRHFQVKNRSSKEEAKTRAMDLQSLLGLEVKDLSRIPPWD